MLLSGCFMASVEDLLRAPKPPEAYVELAPAISELLVGGYRYSPPLAGQNRQQIQMPDLGGNGAEEALVFLGRDDGPLRIYIYAKRDDHYGEICYIEDDSEAVDSVLYADLDGDGRREIIVGWRTGGLKNLAVYSYDGERAVRLMRVSYDIHLIADMTGDGVENLVVLRHDPVKKSGVAELYGMDRDAVFSLLSEAPLSQGMELIKRVITGNLSDGKLAVFVAGQWGGSGTVTDVLAHQRRGLTNISLHENTWASEDNIRAHKINTADVNGDGVVEVPRPILLPAYSEETQDFWCIEWCSYNSFGQVKTVLYTYHNQSDGWYLELPESWVGNLIVRREDIIPGERALIFALQTTGGPVDIVALYTTTLSRDLLNKDSRALIGTHGDTTVLASFPVADIEQMALYSVTAEYMKERLKWIRSDWITGETA